MKNKSFALKAAAAAVVLLGAAMSAQAGSGSASVGVQLNALAVGTCSVTPAAASFALPVTTVGVTAANYVATNFTTIGLNSGKAAGTTLDQTFHIMCGSTVSITSMTVGSVIPFLPAPSVTALKDSSGKNAFGTTSTTTGMAIWPELVSINGSASQFSFRNPTLSGAVVPYATAFNVGTTAVPIVWRPVVMPNFTQTVAFTAPADATGYKTDFVITVNY